MNIWQSEFTKFFPYFIMLSKLYIPTLETDFIFWQLPWVVAVINYQIMIYFSYFLSFFNKHTFEIDLKNHYWNIDSYIVK